jgi:hypothetical protein
MELVLLIALFLVIAVAPVMLAARAMGAANTGFWSCFIALILSSILSTACTGLFGSNLISFIASLLATAVVFSLVLGTSIGVSILISLLAVVIQVGLILVMASIGMAVFSV